MSCADAAGHRWLLASFHGDSCGNSARPALLALSQLVAGEMQDHIVVLGIDANTRSPLLGGGGCGDRLGINAGRAGGAGHADRDDRPGGCPDQMSAAVFGQFVRSLGLVSIWGDSDHPACRATACAQRTLLQAQPHKAVRRPGAAAAGGGPADPDSESRERGVRVGAQWHAKDWVLFCAAQAAAPAQEVGRDNTGERRFDTASAGGPTPGFPSDHAVVFARLCLSPPHVGPRPGPSPPTLVFQERARHGADASAPVPTGLDVATRPAAADSDCAGHGPGIGRSGREDHVGTEDSDGHRGPAVCRFAAAIGDQSSATPSDHGRFPAPGGDSDAVRFDGPVCPRETGVALQEPRKGLPRVAVRAAARWKSLGRTGLADVGTGDLWGLSAPFSSDRLSTRSETFLPGHGQRIADRSRQSRPVPSYMQPSASLSRKSKRLDRGGSFAAVESASDSVDIDTHHGRVWRVEEEVVRLCRQHYQLCISGPAPSALDERNEALSWSTGDRSVWILFSTRPLSSALTQPWARGLMVLMAAIMLLSATASTVDAVRRSSATAMAVRMIPTLGDVANSSAAGAMPAVISNFWLLRQGCRISTQQNASASLNGLELYFDKLVTFDAVRYEYVHASAEFAGFIPRLLVRVEISQDGNSWKELNLPAWLQYDVQALEFTNTSFSKIDIRPRLAWVFQHCIAPVPIVLGCLVATIFSCLGLGPSAAKSIAISHFLFGFVFLAAAVSEYLRSNEALQRRDNRPELSLIGSGSIVLGAVLWYERYTVDCYPIAATVMTAALLVQLYGQNKVVLSDPGVALEAFLPVIITGSSAIFALGFVLARILIGSWVLKQFVRCEREAYQSIWQLISAEQHEALQKLSWIVKAMCHNDKDIQILQCYCKKGTQTEHLHDFCPASDSGGKFAECTEPCVDSPETRDIPSPIRSLDQLYSQATILDILLREKVGFWAHRSSGIVKAKTLNATSEEPSYVSFNTSEGSYQQISSSLKPTERALEKLLRCYDCDPSRLLDCCRQRIIFDNVENIITCLEVIHGDTDLKVLRMKNMLDSNFDPRVTAGFRSFI